MRTETSILRRAQPWIVDAANTRLVKLTRWLELGSWRRFEECEATIEEFQANFEPFLGEGPPTAEEPGS